MAVVPEITSGDEHTAQHVNQPFHIRSAVYDSTNDELDITVGEGRADWGVDQVTEFTAAQTANVASPAINTTYYVYLQSDDTLYTSTSSTYDGSADDAVRLGSVATGSDVSTLTIDDLRGVLPAATAEGSRAHPQRLTVNRSGKDAEGVFTTVKYHRHDGTLFMDSTLSGGTSPEYTTRDVNWYARDGSTVLDSATYTLTYDADGDLTDES